MGAQRRMTAAGGRAERWRQPTKPVHRSPPPATLSAENNSRPVANSAYHVTTLLRFPLGVCASDSTRSASRHSASISATCPSSVFSAGASTSCRMKKELLARLPLHAIFRQPWLPAVTVCCSLDVNHDRRSRFGHDRPPRKARGPQGSRPQKLPKLMRVPGTASTGIVAICYGRSLRQRCSANIVFSMPWLHAGRWITCCTQEPSTRMTTSSQIASDSFDKPRCLSVHLSG
jgi:hypothetical protein